MEEPKNVVTAYKLFKVKQSHPGKLFPLYINADKHVEMNTWHPAEIGEGDGKGKIKSKIGSLSSRPGWHSGDTPSATHIGEKADPKHSYPSYRAHDTVWAEVHVPADVDWQTEANSRASKYKKDDPTKGHVKGEIIPRTAEIKDQIPHGGHYRYKTNSNMTGNWIISGAMKVNRILSDEEVSKINSEHVAQDLPRKQPFDSKKYGFDK